MISVLLLCALMGRLAYLCYFKNSELSRAAVAQRSEKIPVKTARGIIYDRNMMPLTDGQNSLWVAVVPGRCKNLDAVARIIGKPITGNKVQLFPLELSILEQEQLFAHEGVIKLNISDRYMQDGTLSHAIGYHSENSSFGLEGALNSILDRGSDNNFLVVKSAGQKTISGLGLKLTQPQSLSGVRLTVDYHIQQICEQAMDNHIPKGAVIVAEAKTGNILAMASRPNFSQDQLAQHLASLDGDLINRAISAYDLGSIFKIVVTAAALTEGLITPETPVKCTGTCKIAGQDFYCNKLEGHGNISFRQAFAYSCNIPFYALGQKLGMKKIHEYAELLGFGKQVLSIDLGEKKGNIPSSPYTLPGEVANASIGQGAVQVTPLQVANLLCTVADDGTYKQMSIADNSVAADGITLLPMFEQHKKSILKKEVAKTLKSLLVSTVEFGSGVSGELKDYGAGGKTSSAETGWVENGETKTHGWFAGFFPKDDPKYVCVVLCEDGKKGGISAAPVFKVIGEKIMDLLHG